MAKKSQPAEKMTVNSLQGKSMEDNQWQAEDDARTMLRAQEVQGDPKRAQAAHGHLNKQRKHVVSSLSQLKKIAKEKAEEAAGEEPAMSTMSPSPAMAAQIAKVKAKC